MLSDPKRLKTGSSYGYLVSWKHHLRVESEEAARELANRLLRDPYNVEQIRNGIGRPTATIEELEEWLVSGLAAKARVALKTKPRTPVFDRPPITNLTDLLPSELPDPVREVRSWIAVQAVDAKGRPLPFLGFDVTDHAAIDLSTRGDAQARARLDELPSDELHTVTVRWGAGEPYERAEDGVAPGTFPLPTGVHEPCWMKVDLVDRKGRRLPHLQPRVGGVVAGKKGAGASFLAAGIAETAACSVEVSVEEDEG